MPKLSLKVLDSVSKEQKHCLVALSITYIMMNLTLTNLMLYLPSEAKTHGISASVSGAMFSCCAVATVLSSPFTGILIAEIGPKIVLVAGIVFNGLFSSLFGLVTHIESDLWFTISCFACLTLATFGLAAINTATYTYAAKIFPDNMGLVVGTLETYYAISEIIALPIGAVLFDWGGFSAPFIFFGLLQFVVFPIDICLLPSEKKRKETEVSLEIGHPEVILHTGLENGGTTDNCVILRNNTEDKRVLTTSPPTVAQVTSNASASKGKLKPWHLLLIPRTTLMALVLVVVGVCWSFIIPTLEPHLDLLGLSTTQKANMVLLTSIVYGISSPLWGFVADRMSGKTWILMSSGLLVAGVSFGFLGPLPFTGLVSTVWLNIITLSLITTTLAMAGVPAVEATLLYTLEAGHEDNMQTYAIVSSLISTAYSGGTAIGPLLGGFLVDGVGFPWSAGFCGAIAVIWGSVVILYFSTCYSPPAKIAPGETLRQNLRRSSRHNSESCRSEDLKRQSFSGSITRKTRNRTSFVVDINLDPVIVGK